MKVIYKISLCPISRAMRACGASSDGTCYATLHNQRRDNRSLAVSGWGQIPGGAECLVQPLVVRSSSLNKSEHAASIHQWCRFREWAIDNLNWAHRCSKCVPKNLWPLHLTISPSVWDFSLSNKLHDFVLTGFQFLRFVSWRGQSTVTWDKNRWFSFD